MGHCVPIPVWPWAARAIVNYRARNGEISPSCGGLHCGRIGAMANGGRMIGKNGLLSRELVAGPPGRIAHPAIATTLARFPE